MQIKLATARGVGYTGDAAGLRDPDTNLTYGIKYLAGAWRAANGDHDRAMRYYAERLLLRGKTAAAGAPSSRAVLASAPPQEVAKPKRLRLSRSTSTEGRSGQAEAGFEEARRRQGAGSEAAGSRTCRCKRAKAALTRPAIGLH